MARFLIHAGGEIIGRSNLETGDPPMGVASGVFMPSDRYRRDKHASCISPLTVTRADGREVGPCIGVDITDLGPDQLGDPLWIDVVGLRSELYEELFPEHLLAHEQRFR
ncbi:MAG: hypothetical protein AAFP18_09460 [Bacteroidota bacterium]